MLRAYQKILLISALLFNFNFSYGQSDEIKITFIGNCGLYLTDGATNLYVDFPYKSGAHHYMKYDKSEIDSIKENSIFIFTHKHSDHFSKKRVKKLKGKVFGPWNINKLEQLNETIKNFKIEFFKTKHKFSFHHYSYLIIWNKKRIYISGDTENSDTIAKIKDIDWAFVPAWLIMDAKEKKIKIDTKMFGLYHIGSRDHISTNDSKVHLLNKQGEVFFLK